MPIPSHIPTRQESKKELRHSRRLELKDLLGIYKLKKINLEACAWQELYAGAGVATIVASFNVLVVIVVIHIFQCLLLFTIYQYFSCQSYTKTDFEDISPVLVFVDVFHVIVIDTIPVSYLLTFYVVKVIPVLQLRTFQQYLYLLAFYIYILSLANY